LTSSLAITVLKEHIPSLSEHHNYLTPEKFFSKIVSKLEVRT